MNTFTFIHTLPYLLCPLMIFIPYLNHSIPHLSHLHIFTVIVSQNWMKVNLCRPWCLESIRECALFGQLREIIAWRYGKLISSNFVPVVKDQSCLINKSGPSTFWFFEPDFRTSACSPELPSPTSAPPSCNLPRLFCASSQSIRPSQA